MSSSWHGRCSIVSSGRTIQPRQRIQTQTQCSRPGAAVLGEWLRKDSGGPSPLFLPLLPSHKYGYMSGGRGLLLRRVGFLAQPHPPQVPAGQSLVSSAGTWSSAKFRRLLQSWSHENMCAYHEMRGNRRRLVDPSNSPLPTKHTMTARISKRSPWCPLPLLAHTGPRIPASSIVASVST
jgi:hypothetical protein